MFDASRADQQIHGLASLDQAGPMHLAFFDNAKYADQLAATRAGACMVSAQFEAMVPSHVAVLRVEDPFGAFVRFARELYRGAMRPHSWFDNSAIAPSAVIHPTARLEDGVVVDPLAVIGPGVEIGAGTVIGSGAVIGAKVRIGRDCDVGAGCTVQLALIGNNVLVHPGCHIGQDGYGFVAGPGGHLKVPQTGRVLIQNGVEIGAGTTIDRGSVSDTVIGEGTKIDNLVQIGHNVRIGRRCLIAAQVVIGGNSSLGDFVELGAKVGINQHIQIGDGAKVAAISFIADDVPTEQSLHGNASEPGSKPQGPKREGH